MKRIASLLIIALILTLTACGKVKCDEHTDTNGDDLCDECRSTVAVYIDVIAINDLHGKILDTDEQPGVDELSTYIENTRAEGNLILLSTGDMWQGSSESNLTGGNMMTDWMNELEFDAMALGNHEFDWGEDAIRENADIAEFPFLAINVFDTETDERVEYARASVSLEVGGARIGIIGAIGDCYSSISSDMVAGVYFKVGNELTELVKDEARKLREEGCDYIIYSLHDGHDRSQSSEGFISSSKLAPYYDIELSDGYVDMVFEAHTHQSYVLKDSNGVSHMQGGGENKGISHAEIKINTANGNSRLQSIDYVNNSLYKNLNDHPVVDLLEEKYAEELEIANRYIGKNSSYRSSDELRRLIAKLYYEAAIAEFGNEYDIVLGGGFLSVRSPYELEPGEVRYKDVQSIFPFDNELVLCSIKGYDLKYRFFETDNSSYYIYTGEYGDGIRNNIDLEATYYVMVDTYTSSYAPNRLTVVEYYPALIYARDLLCDYISAGNFE